MDKVYIIESYGHISNDDPVFLDEKSAETHADEMRDAEGFEPDDDDRDCIRVVEFKMARKWPDVIWEQRKPDPTRKKRRPRWFWVPVNWMNYFSHVETQRNTEEYEPYDFSRDY